MEPLKSEHDRASTPSDSVKEAMLYEKLSDGSVRCNLCAHRCVIARGKRGICYVRENSNGSLYTLVYGRIIAEHVDPVEKKPLFHFYPGSTSYSIATLGCNFRCQWCQNWEISQMPQQQHLLMGEKVSPEEIVTNARRAGSRSIAYTYTEPTVFFEYTYDSAKLARDAGLASVYVTNGYMTAEMLRTMKPYLDAANVDLKGFRDETYRKYVGARLQPVLDSLREMKRLGIWIEVTTLVVPGVNDDPAELENAAKFIANDLGVDTPWHISRFFPAYKMTDASPTPIATLQRARQIGLEAGLRYVYLGNVRGQENTFCPGCGKLLINRSSYSVLKNAIQPDSRCPHCGTLIPGVGMKGTP